jgi:pyridoxine 5-phosphate synthase
MKPTLVVTLNKLATLRNARGGSRPSLVDAADVLARAGCRDLLVHYWPDGRHITLADVLDLARSPTVSSGRCRLHLGSDFRADVVELLINVPNIAGWTVAPFEADKLTTSRGWAHQDAVDDLAAAIAQMPPTVVTTLFVDPTSEGISLSKDVGAHGVDLNCSRYVEARDFQERRAALAVLSDAALAARKHGLAIGLAHNLGQEHLSALTQAVRADRVSVGHNYVCDSVLVGLGSVLGDYIGQLHECMEEEP